jgi:quercetin dioxygenase-like cupin family protein
MSAPTPPSSAQARAELPASYTEVRVAVRGELRVGAEGGPVTVRTGDSVHVPGRTPGVVEALEDTAPVCVSAPAH